MRTLVIAGEYPWPVNSGSRMRLRTTLEGLRRCGPVELCAVLPGARTDIAPPDDALDLERVTCIRYDERVGTGEALVTGLLRPGVPFPIPWGRRTTVAGRFHESVSGRYDLVWCYGVRPWLLAGEPALAPTVIDFDDLEDQKIRARLAVPNASRPGGIARLRDLGARLYSEEEARRWRRLERRSGRSVQATVVCSALDAARATQEGIPGVQVVPNAYPEVAVPLGRPEVGSPPTLLFQGTLRYPPNAQAASYLVEEVGPLVRDLVPGVQIRLVGVGAAALAALDDPPQVVLVGPVDDIGTELARADVVVVPIRFGSGTRVKILEAFAHRIPVVSTSRGAEGLAVRDGEHLLLADTPDAIARACARLLGDSELRADVASAAHELFRRHYASGQVVEVIGRLARAVAGT